MTKIITCSELRYRTLEELEALFRTLQIELGRTAPGSPERTIVLASLESVRRAMAATPRPAAEATRRPSARVFVGPAAPRRSAATGALYSGGNHGLNARTRRGVLPTGDAMSRSHGRPRPGYGHG